jgi:hypothetical protein
MHLGSGAKKLSGVSVEGGLPKTKFHDRCLSKDREYDSRAVRSGRAVPCELASRLGGNPRPQTPQLHGSIPRARARGRR